MLTDRSPNDSLNSPKSHMLAKSKIPFALLLPLILFAFFAAGCGSSSEPAQSNVSVGAAIGSTLEVGYRVGQTIRPFTLRLVDGTTLTSEDLINQNQPTMIFFFKIG